MLGSFCLVFGRLNKSGGSRREREIYVSSATLIPSIDSPAASTKDSKTQPKAASQEGGRKNRGEVKNHRATLQVKIHFLLFLGTKPVGDGSS